MRSKDGSCAVCHKRINTIRDVFIEFCEKTATRGLPRAVREPSTVWKAIWYVAVLGMFCFAVSQITLLLIQYYQYEVIQRETTNHESSYHFPSVTVCNLSPIKSNKNVSLDAGIPVHLQSLQAYYNYLDHVKLLYPKLKPQIDRIRSTEGFFHNIPKSKHHLYGHNALDLVNYCLIRMSNGFSSYYSKNCSIMKITQSPLFYNCFTIDMSTIEAQRAITLSIILFLDDSTFPLDIKYAQNSDIFGQSLGAKISIHESGTFPDITHGSTKIGPGVASWIILQSKEWVKLGEPFEPCLDNKANPHKIENNGLLFNYTKASCRMACLQDYLASRCRCLEPSWPMTSFQILQYPYCMNLTDNPEDLQMRLKCRDDIEWFDHDCNSRCLSKCHRFAFGEQVSSSTWPHVSSQLSFYEQHIKNRPYGPRFSVYDKYLTYAKTVDVANNVTAQEFLYKELNTYDLIARNFLQINIHRNFELRIINEIPAYKAQQLLSGIGGIFSLTIGITMITVIELLELLYRLFLFICFYRKWVKSSSRGKLDACSCDLYPPEANDVKALSAYGAISESDTDSKE